mmetsp:Transcript_21521/g.39362  ORF Transcript_21521/g.39362 Transcript_21521/m.39362 type:complete len:283 (-) Transcript_21521:1445-2293(-)
MQGKNIPKNASSPRLSSGWSLRRSSSSQSVLDDEYAHVNSRSKQVKLSLLKYNSMSSRLSLTRAAVRKHSCPIEEFPRAVERVKLHMKSPILFDRQLSRPEAVTTNAHESRFTIINDYPVISTKFKRVVSPVFSKSMGRKQKKEDSSPTTEYSPKIEVVRDHAGLGSPIWKSKQGRKSLTAKLETHWKDYDVNFGSIDRQVSVPLFDKSPSRPQSTLGSLPSFMCSINTRQGMRLINEKSLKMSEYAKWDYYLPESAFSKTASKSMRSVNSGKSSPKRNKGH